MVVCHPETSIRPELTPKVQDDMLNRSTFFFFMQKKLYKYIGSLVIVGFFLALFFGVFFWMRVQKETWQGEGA